MIHNCKLLRLVLPKKGFVLLQGPPGTGKTKTICGLLSVLLNSAPHAIPNPSDTMISDTNNHNNKNNNNKNNSHNNNNNNEQHHSIKTSRSHVLVCAPSNAAVDEIVLRVLREGLEQMGGGETDGKSKKYQPSIVRLGEMDSMHPEVREASLQQIILRKSNDPNSEVFSQKQKIEERRQKISDHKQQITNTNQEITALKDEITELEKKQLSEKDPESSNNLSETLSTKNARVRELMRQKRVLQEKLTNLQKDSGDFSGNSKDNLNTHEKIEKNLVRTVLNESSIIFCTLSTAGSEKMQMLLNGFDTVIIDEAAQAVEVSTLIPLRYGCKTCVLVGDPCQLPATVLSKTASSYQYEQSLFQRLQQAKQPVWMLTTQYRMHPSIRRFPSQHFYQGRLEDGENVLQYDVTEKDLYKAVPLLRSFGAFVFLDLKNSLETSSARSYTNSLEVKTAVLLYKELSRSAPFSVAGRVGIITPYKQQYYMLCKEFQREFGRNILEDVDINTVDGFQGREKDFIIFSCVRAHSADSGAKSIGFLADIRRMNVGLTRARLALFVIGNRRALQVNPNWGDLIKDATTRERVVVVEQPERFFAKWGGDEKKNSHSSTKSPVSSSSPTISSSSSKSPLSKGGYYDHNILQDITPLKSSSKSSNNNNNNNMPKSLTSAMKKGTVATTPGNSKQVEFSEELQVKTIGNSQESPNTLVKMLEELEQVDNADNDKGEEGEVTEMDIDNDDDNDDHLELSTQQDSIAAMDEDIFDMPTQANTNNKNKDTHSDNNNNNELVPADSAVTVVEDNNNTNHSEVVVLTTEKKSSKEEESEEDSKNKQQEPSSKEDSMKKQKIDPREAKRKQEELEAEKTKEMLRALREKDRIQHQKEKELQAKKKPRVVDSDALLQTHLAKTANQHQHRSFSAKIKTFTDTVEESWKALDKAKQMTDFASTKPFQSKQIHTGNKGLIYSSNNNNNSGKKGNAPKGNSKGNQPFQRRYK